MKAVQKKLEDSNKKAEETSKKVEEANKKVEEYSKKLEDIKKRDNDSTSSIQKVTSSNDDSKLKQLNDKIVELEKQKGINHLVAIPLLTQSCS